MEQKYVELLEKLLIDIDTIDGETPWQNTEPEWWLQMMTLRRQAQQFKNGYDS